VTAVDAPATAAPTAPGSLGRAPEPAELQTYLTELDAWLRARRSELDDLDDAALAAGRGAEVAADMALALSLWHGVEERYRRLWALWDGGRVLAQDREQMATLIWSRLDGSGTSVPETCRLCDALAGQLRTRLALTPGADASAARIKQLRAQLERIRDQVGLEPATGRDAAVERLAALLARANDIADRAGRGADVGGLLAPVEQDAAVFERDLIVGNQRRRDAREQVAQAYRLRADLEQREAELTTLAATCVATVEPAPRYAVPDVDALGPVPEADPEAVGPYLERLARVGQALGHARERYASALAEHTDLVSLLDAWVVRAGAAGLAAHPDLTASERLAREVLARRPAPMPVCRQLVATYQTWLQTHQTTGRTP
jgi:hypothetical protein